MKKEVLLLVSDKFDLKDGYVEGSSEVRENLDTFFVLQTSPNSQSGFMNDELNLKLGRGKQKILFRESLPVNPLANAPVISCVAYDEQAFIQSEKVGECPSKQRDCFQTLHSQLNNGNANVKVGAGSFIPHGIFSTIMYFKYCEPLKKLHSFLHKSHWYTHFVGNIESVYDCLKNEAYAKSKTRTINLYSIKIFDFLLGCIAIYLLLRQKENVWDSMLHSTKYVIDELKKVLHILMGSPAGLKLNCALNQTLGKFFFYHISLWKVFIESIFFVSLGIVYGFVALGSLGLSYQIALCADVIMLLTFHVYCIYVYAARVYRVQIYAITSLWRLFIGRKYNPLKNRVDSFQYSHDQLFVGSLGFTVLLFLLPTTFLYYIVFTLFRIVVLIVCKLIVSTAKSLSSMPLYFFFLRLTGSSRIRGTVRIYATKNAENSTLRLHATLDPLECWFQSDVKVSTAEGTERSLHDYLHCVCTGELL